ncbi:Starch synthase 1, chloroplastic/amyloplastic [Symbiodinium microadriaticum]|uniref:Starch synthase 1, chloroplastic/amyloplastic n=1 Tax=Symbiodinium microadriaticum TaxID=2951 RepID=A0A1Q9CRL8_SYMMI|nr:Starch synthase 1, chloroplastic/amyloplastic [Symbiodinium microadriaticum]
MRQPTRGPRQLSRLSVRSWRGSVLSQRRQRPRMPKRPAGELSLGRQAEWEAYVRKLVSKVCSAAEVPTVKRALLTLRELQHFQAARGRNGLEAVDRVPTFELVKATHITDRPKLSANPSMDFTALLEGEDKETLAKLKEEAGGEASTESSPSECDAKTAARSTMSRISTEDATSGAPLVVASGLWTYNQDSAASLSDRVQGLQLCAALHEAYTPKGAPPLVQERWSGHRGSAAKAESEASTFNYEALNLDVPVVIVSSELHPWSKSGGLAIVAAQYAYNFAVRGHRTMAIAPMYDTYEGAFYQCTKSFELFGGTHEVRYFHHFQDYGNGKGADYVFIDHPSFHRPGGLYHNTSDNQEYADNLFRFALFSLAALEVPVSIELGGAPRYGGRVMFIANDWQTGLLPVYMVHRHRAYGNYNDARCMYVIHNLGYQGCYPLRLGLPGTLQYDNFAQLGLPFAALGDLLYQYPLHERTFEGDTGETLNLTKGAIQCCDRIVTVSPTYADEIRTPEGGFRLHDFVSAKSYYLVGILNGIDDSWDPTTDKSIAAKFTPEEDEDACIFGFVGRLTSQKGLDLIGSCIHWLMEDHKDGLRNVQLVMMGNGEEHLGHMLRWAESTWKGRVCGYWGFNPHIEREIIAGSDFFLMPSRLV